VNPIPQTVIDHFGVAVAAVTGVLAARGKQVDLFGVVVLAVVTAFGGGTIRDLTLGDLPVFWAREPWFVINAAITAVVTFYLVRFRDLPTAALLVADAVVLACFTMAGAKKALVFQVAPTTAVVMGVITGVVGGILRDVLTNEIPIVFRRETCLYATAAFVGATVFVLINNWSGDLRSGALAGILITLLLRLAGIRWKISLPVFQATEGKDDEARP
jgi:uncharacterized membrane protein YeiH